MDSIILNIISVVVTAVIVPLISLLGTKLYQLINNKIKDEKAAKYLNDASTIVIDAVRTVFQTYVETLKNQGSFNKDAQIIALNKAKEIVMAQLSTDTQEYLKANFGDVGEWVSNKIEASINLLKN